MNEISLKPVGKIKCEQLYTYDVPRQPGLVNNHAVIEIVPDYQQAMEGLADFSKIWVLFLFDQSEEKLMVKPPRLKKGSVGVFATRSPFRLNRIGMSVVKLEKIDGNQIFISDHDLINGTPVLDIKPYISEYDSHKTPVEGWMNNLEISWKIGFLGKASEKLEFLGNNGFPNLRSFLESQLSYLPDDVNRKRIKNNDDGTLTLSYRTWRIVYSIEESQKVCMIQDIHSGWSVAELSDGTDPYEDKEIHRSFLQKFS